MDTFNEIYSEICLIPKGNVASYGYIAERMGDSRLSHTLDYALNRGFHSGDVPCHRVVGNDGSLNPTFAFGGAERQRTLLEMENVGFLPDGRVDIEKYGLKI